MQISITVEGLECSMFAPSEEGVDFVVVTCGGEERAVEVALLTDPKSGMWGAHVDGVYGREWSDTPEMAWKAALREYVEVHYLGDGEDLEDNEWHYEDDPYEDFDGIEEDEYNYENRQLEALSYRDDYRDYSSEG